MKFPLIIVMLMLFGIASAETIAVGNYSIDFNLSKPHIIEDLGDNMTAVKTFDGYIAFQPTHLGIEVPDKVGFVGSLYVDGVKGEMGDFYNYKNGVRYYILNCAHWHAFSTLSLQETLDFVQTMASNPTKAT